MSTVGKKQLFDDSGSDEEDDSKIKINKSYAQRYDEWREAEIKRKLEDRYGNLDEQLSTSSSDDDDPQELEKALSKDFFEVISRLRKKDPKIYNPDMQFFKTEEQPSTSQGKQKKEKPIYLRDYERKLIVERGGVLSDDESDTEHPQRPASPSLAEKERSLKESLQKVVHSDSDNDEDNLLIKKVKTEEQKKKEEDDYIEWLRGRKEELKDKNLQESLSYLKEEWNNPNLDEGEKFLRDYVLNKRYLDGRDEDVDAGNLTDEDFQDKYMDDFERKFNFRFEEPDGEFLKRYPRTIESSVRKKDDRRKRHRDEVKKRKEEEKLRQREELKVLKSLKRKEILKKIEKIKEITGNAELGISDKDLEGDYDPEEHDRRMNELFNDDYYREGDEELNLEDLPLPPLDEDLADDYENWDEYEGEKEEGQMDEELHCEDPNFIMDCDFDPEAARLAKEAQPKSSRERRKLKRQSRFGTLVRKKKPQFDPNEKSFQEYVDEYYGIDYEDIIGGQPCRFKYRKVMPNSFGLTIEEILAADDKELNAWVSIKKATALRPDHVELNEKRMYELKAQNEALKRKILPSLYKNETEENCDEGEDRPRSKKKKKSFSGEDTSTFNEDETDTTAASVNKKKKKSFVGEDSSTFNEDEMDTKAAPVNKKKKKKFFGEEDISTFNEDEADIKATPVNERKNKSFSGEDTSTFNEDETDTTAAPVNKKKKKKFFGEEDISTFNEDEADIKATPVNQRKNKSFSGEDETDIRTTSEKKKKKKKSAEEDDCVEPSDAHVKKKSKHRVNESDTGKEEVDEVHGEAAQEEENSLKEVPSQKLSKKERKKLERQFKESTSNTDSVETPSDISRDSEKKGKKRRADVMDESIDDIAPPLSDDRRLKKKQKRSENSSQESEKIEKSPKKKSNQGDNQPKSSNPNKNRGQRDVKKKDNKNKVLQKPVSTERTKRQRRGKDTRKKRLLVLQKNTNKAPRDLKAENRERTLRRQNYKVAPVVGEMSDSRLKAYGINPKKFKNKLVYG